MGVVSPIAALGVVVPVLVGLAQGERPGGLAARRHRGRRSPASSWPAARSCRGAAGARPVLLAAVAAVGFGLALLAHRQGQRDAAP